VRSVGRSIVIGVIAVALYGATTADASYTIGQTTGAVDNCGSDQVLVQRSVNAAPSYTASSNGVVVSWSYLAHAGNSNITFKVYHSTAQVTTWFVRSASAERHPGAGAGQIHPNALNTFAESPGIPIQAGDVLGLTGRMGTGMACINTSSANDRIRVKAPPDPAPGADSPGFAGELPQLKLGVTAVVEPDADGDHFGDETQDGCPTDATVHATACPVDVQIVKTASANPTVGTDMTYTLAVKNNNATSSAGAVGVTDTLPSGVTFVSATPSQGACSGDATVTCALGPVAGGASATVSIVVKPGAAGPLSNTATVSTSSPDTDSSNDSSTAATTVALPPPIPVAPVLRSLKIAPAAFLAKKGTTISYTNSQDSTTTFTVAKRARGVKKGKRCVAPPKKKPKKKPVRCTRFLKRDTFSRVDKAGPVSFHYNARVKGKLLKPGRYRLRAVARNAAGASLPLSASFRIKKP
jgi:uncharacterized repeat protein (TIGR01451 family)